MKVFRKKECKRCKTFGRNKECVFCKGTGFTKGERIEEIEKAIEEINIAMHKANVNWCNGKDEEGVVRGLDKAIQIIKKHFIVEG